MNIIGSHKPLVSMNLKRTKFPKWVIVYTNTDGISIARINTEKFGLKGMPRDLGACLVDLVASFFNVIVTRNNWESLEQYVRELQETAGCIHNDGKYCYVCLSNAQAPYNG